MIADLLIQLRYSARSWLRAPVLSLALILTIGLGVASNASIDALTRGLADSQQPFPPEMFETIRLLLRTAALGVFVIACANVAAFLLARSAARTRETAVRVAIGAGRAHLIRQVIAESVLIATAGAIAGGMLAYWIARIVPAFLYDQDAERMRFAHDPGGLVFIVGACTAITVACGLLPLIETRADDPGAIMQRENSGPSRTSLRIGAALVVLQMAGCTTLLISAGLLYSSYRSSLFTSTGQRLAHAAIATVEALQMSSKFQQANGALEYFDEVARHGTSLVRPAAIGWSATLPGDRPVWQTFQVEAADAPTRSFTFESAHFTRRTIERIVTPPVRGRLFGTADNGPCGGVVLSVEAAQELGAGPIIGRSIQSPSGEWTQVVGVVRLLQDSPQPVVFHYAPDADETVPVASTYLVPHVDEALHTQLDVNIVSENYFDLLGLRLIAGTSFTDSAGACRVGIVNTEAADRDFGGNAVGAAIIDRLGRRTSIIGVVSSAKLRGAQRDIVPTLYLPMQQDVQPRMTMIMETEGVSDRTLRELHRRIALTPGGREDRTIVTTLDRHLSRTAFAPERIATVLVGSSAAVALIMGLLGLYGVMSDATRRRRREFALRIALGAGRSHLIRQVIAEATRLVIAGATAGVAGAWIVGRWLSEVTPDAAGPSPLAWLAPPLALAIAVAVASVLPARRALATDPLLIMRVE